MNALTKTTDDRPLPDPALADLVPLSVADEFRVVPFQLLGGVLVFAGPQRVAEKELERLGFILNRKVHCTVRPDEWYEHARARLHATSMDTADSAERSVSYYWGGWYYWDGDTLVAKASGWEAMSHWTGVERFPPEHEDHDLMCWLLNCKSYRRVIDRSEIPRIRRVWRRWLARKEL